MDSKEFKAIQEMIAEGFAYNGLVPVFTFKQLKTRFAEVTKGKDIRDYIKFNEDNWKNRKGYHAGNKFMNRLRVNYIKKETKWCVGRDEKTPCPRELSDLQNEIPWRLQVCV